MPPDAAPPIADDDEASLVARARDGDTTAFRRLHSIHHDRVFRTVLAILRHTADAEDVAQEVWVAAWRELPRFRGTARFSTWLHPVAVRRSIDHLRRRRRSWSRFFPFLADGAAEPADDEAPGPRDGAEDADRAAALDRALGRLSPEHRAVLALREVEGLSYEEIATSVGCRLGTVMSRLHHARRALLREFHAAGETSATSAPSTSPGPSATPSQP